MESERHMGKKKGKIDRGCRARGERRRGEEEGEEGKATRGRANDSPISV